MTTYLFLKELFTNVLAKSIVMQGRLCICPKYGQEINSGNMDAVIPDLVKDQPQWKWPGVLMMPPVSEMNLKDDNGEWERYRIELWFLTTTYATGNNQIKAVNKNTQTSTHTIVEDWHDMKRCARDFSLMLFKIGFGKPAADIPYRLPSEKKFFDPMSLQGNTRLSGVRLIMKIDIWTGCVIEDYPANSWDTVTIPDPNIHPTHFH